MLSAILETITGYGALGVIAYILLKENQKRQNVIMKTHSERELQYQQNFQQLLESVLRSNENSLVDLKLSIKELSEAVREMSEINMLTQSQLHKKIDEIKEGCSINCSQVLTGIYEEKGIPKTLAYELTHSFLLMSVYQAIVDIESIMDANGFDREQTVAIMKDSVIRVFERRFNELKIRIGSLSYKENSVLETISNLEKIFIESNDKISIYMGSVNVDTLTGDKNYKNLKTVLRNILFDFSDNATKILSKNL